MRKALLVQAFAPAVLLVVGAGIGEAQAPVCRDMSAITHEDVTLLVSLDCPGRRDSALRRPRRGTVVPA